MTTLPSSGSYRNSLQYSRLKYKLYWREEQKQEQELGKREQLI